MSQIITCVLGFAVVASVAIAQPAVVGFSPSRGGVTNIVSGAEFDQIRAAMLQVHPGTTFRGVDALTSISNSTDDIVVVASGSGAVTAITPLSAAEQSALLNFILAGGSAIILVDNDTFNGASSDPANESLLDPFGFDVIGTGAPWARTAVAVNASSPVMTGPYGTIATYNVGWSGWFNTVGPAGSVLARLNDNSEPSLAEIPCNALGPGSGRVLLFSDTTMLIDTYATSTNLALFKNAFAYALAPPCDPPCAADFNGDDGVDDLDIVAFFTAFEQGEPAADVNGDDGIDDLDIVAFFAAFEAGC